MYRVCIGSAILALSLVTWPHFSDPPSGSEARDDPRLVSSWRQASSMAFSLFLDCSLPLRLFVYSFVHFLGSLISVVLFVCVASACIWQLLHDHGQTTTRRRAGIVFILLLLGDASQPRPDFYGTKIERPVPGGKQSPDSLTLASTTIQYDIRNYEYSVTKRMLLLIAGLES